MKAILTGLYSGSMRGRTMYVVPFCMGPYDAPTPKLGVEITDSEYVVASMRVMTRMGAEALELINTGLPWVKALHSVGAPLAPGRAGCRLAVQRHQVHRAVPRGADDLVVRLRLRRKCLAGQEVLLAADRLGDGPRRGLAGRAHADHEDHLAGSNEVKYIAAAFPSACGKTNLAMLEPTIPGWKVETLGDDIAWMTFGEDGRLYAVNPEYGLFGVAPGTGWNTNPNAMRTIAQGNSVFTNVALTDDGDIWWEGMTDEPPAHLTDWKGRDWTPSGLDADGNKLASAGEPSSHPNSRFCTPITQCPILADEYFAEPQGVPISAILFGGRRKTTIPLVTQSTGLAARRLHGRHAVQRDHRGGDRRGRRRPPRPDGHAAVHRLQRRRLLRALDRRRQGRRRDEAAGDLLRQLVPPGRGRRVPVARIRRELAGC